MKKILIPVLCLCLLLAGCKPAPEPVETTAAPTETTQAPTEVTTQPTTEATTVSTEPQIYRHPLTGEILEAPLTVRPIAVSTNNYSPAQPILGVSHADIIFEHVTEGLGSETRMLALYTDLDFEGQLGSVRSARTYSVNLARAFNACMVHCGGSYLANDLLRSIKFPTFDEFSYGKYYYRDKARQQAGYSNEHTLVIEPESLLKGLEEQKFDMSAPADAYYGLDFADEINLGGESAKTVSIRFYNEEGKRTVMTYNAEDGMYYGEQKWWNKERLLADGNNDVQVPFKNVMILKVKLSHVPNKPNTLQEVLGEGTGYFACGGEYVAIKWSRPTGDDLYSFTLEDGTPLNLGVGKTYIAILPIRSPDVIFE